MGGPGPPSLSVRHYDCRTFSCSSLDFEVTQHKFVLDEGLSGRPERLLLARTQWRS